MASGNYKRKVFDSALSSPFKISRTKIDLFVECPRCLYLSEKLGVSRPSLPAFTLNSAVDHLLKKEFDIHRESKTAHPLMEKYKVEAIPWKHPDLEKWRHNFSGIQFHHPQTNFLVFGAIDDVWINPKGELHIVDYKATSKSTEPTLEGRWQEGYKRQMEIYQWLFRKNGFPVSSIGYFVYVNGRRDEKAFDAHLEFDVFLIPYKGDDVWIEKTLQNIKECLMKETVPPAGALCEYCPYRENAGKAIRALYDVPRKKKDEKNVPEKLF